MTINEALKLFSTPLLRSALEELRKHDLDDSDLDEIIANGALCGAIAEELEQRFNTTGALTDRANSLPSSRQHRAATT